MFNIVSHLNVKQIFETSNYGWTKVIDCILNSLWTNQLVILFALPVLPHTIPQPFSTLLCPVHASPTSGSEHSFFQLCMESSRCKSLLELGAWQERESWPCSAPFPLLLSLGFYYWLLSSSSRALVQSLAILLALSLRGSWVNAVFVPFLVLPPKVETNCWGYILRCFMGPSCISWPSYTLGRGSFY